MALVDTIYYEESVREHPRVKNILTRFAAAEHIACGHYGEVFNPRAQNFRVQKQNPALILAHKSNKRVLAAPAGYGIGGDNNYYFSHMLNCLYDCRYCFLQGMYRSAHYVLFVNYEDFSDEIVQTAMQHGNEPTYFFSGYDCDSLALEPISGFAEYFLSAIRRVPNAYLELRTKSTQIRRLLEQEPTQKVIVAFSLSPQEIIDGLEHKAPRLDKRIEAVQKLALRGWPIGLRFDPLIYHCDYQKSYAQMFKQVFEQIDVRAVHSVNIGAFRLPSGFFKNMVKFYPDEKLFAGPLHERQGMVSYAAELEQEMRSYCLQQLRQWLPQEKIYECQFDG